MALICQTSRGNMWEKGLWTQEAWAGRLCPPAFLHGDSSHSGFLLLSPTGGGPSTGSPHSCTQPTTPDGGDGDATASPSRWDHLRGVSHAVSRRTQWNGAPSAFSRNFSLARPWLASPRPPTGASWGHCHIKCLHPVPCLCRNPAKGKVLALTSRNQR